MAGKIFFISTGGTIAMRYDSEKGGEYPSLGCRELIASIPGLADVAEVEPYEYGNVPSAHMTPAIMLDLGRRIDDLLARDDVDGVVLTHGTDTLEETAYFLDLWVNSDKPVCLTGAMRSSTDLSPDGPANVLGAVSVAASGTVGGCGVLVVLNNEIHAAGLVTKMNSSALQSFTSPAWGPLGRITPEGIVIQWRPERHECLRSENPLHGVPIVKNYTGMDGASMEWLFHTPLEGVVIEGFGVGNVSPGIVPSIERLLRQGVPVVVTSRVPSGPLLGAYAAEGGGSHLRSLGVILAGELSSQKARIKLMMALGKTRDHQELTRIFMGERATWYGGCSRDDAS